MIKKTLSMLVLILHCVATAATGADSQDRSREEWWSVNIRLDNPFLFPPAVQWAVVDADPVPAFIERIAASRTWNAGQLASAKDERQRRVRRSAQMMVAWDRGFKSVSGDNLYLLTDNESTLTSDSPDGKKWIVTKVVTIEGEPTCWCIPIEARKGTTLRVTLTDTNTFDISSAYESGMRKPPQDQDSHPTGKPKQ